MISRMRLVICAATVASLLPMHDLRAEQGVPVANEAAASHPATALAESLYQGWRASRLLDSFILSRDGKRLGQVRNLVVADNGQIEALLAEEAGLGTRPEFVFRLPWSRVVKPVQPGAIIADLSDNRRRDFGLFSSTSDERPPNFLISKVLGDYVRLQTGLGYGYVSDVVFDKHGKMHAILVAREAFAGGGTFAFPYPGQTGRWNAGMSYYGLPYVTLDQANEAGLRVDRTKFEDGTG